jgi:hypothetical protein
VLAPGKAARRRPVSLLRVRERRHLRQIFGGERRLLLLQVSECVAREQSKPSLT